VIAFSVAALAQMKIDSGMTPHISWQLLAYTILTAAEVMVSITCLEFSYTQAPKKMKSFIMAFFMMSIALGNLFTSAVNFFIQNPDGSSKLEGADYYWFFTLIMLGTAVLFLLVVKFYREKTYIHAEQPS
jgi:POT family proton-dependent oligopeptide transporter